MSGTRGGGRRKQGAGAGTSGPLEDWVWDGNTGPALYHPPIPEFPLQTKREFNSTVNPLRRYDNRKTIWPKCMHGLDCVVQMFDGGDGNGGRRFFRCPQGEHYGDVANCGFTRWVDPKPIDPTMQYISYLQDRIVHLQNEIDNSTPNPTESEHNIISIADDNSMCCDPFCKCPHHKSGPTNRPPPPPPYYGGQGYNDDVGYSQSGGHSNYSPWN